MARPGRRVGWLDGETVYLDRDAALAAARELGDDLTITRDTLTKRLHERGHLAATEAEQGELTIRRTLGRQRRRVVAVHLSLSIPLRNPANPANRPACGRIPAGGGRIHSGDSPIAKRYPASKNRMWTRKTGRLAGLAGLVAREPKAKHADDWPDSRFQNPANGAEIRPMASRIRPMITNRTAAPTAANRVARLSGARHARRRRRGTVPAIVGDADRR